MAYEHKEGSGAIFKNAKKDAGSKQPDYRGNIMLGGVVYELAGWTKNGGQGPFLSINGKVQGQYSKDAPKPAPMDELDSDLPF